MSYRFARLIALFLLIAVLAACTPAPSVAPTQPAPATAAPTAAPVATPAPSPTLANPVSPLPTPGAQGSPLAPNTGTGQADDPALALATILANADAYVGQQVTVAGELMTEGNASNVRFYLEADGGQRLAVVPWLPIEVMQPAQGGAAPESMANYAGRYVTLTGMLEKGEQGLRLMVSSATAQ